MENIWTILIAITLFLVITFLVRKLFNIIYKKEYSEKMRNTWGARMYYWHFVIMISGALTTLIVILLVSKDVLLT